MRRPVRIFSIVFNDPYVSWFEHGCVPSLCWPLNNLALRSAVVWDIWTTPEWAVAVSAIAQRVGIPLSVRAELEPSSWDEKEGLKLNLTKALTAEMAKCVAEGQAFLWIAPDSIFGDGSIRAIMDLGEVPGVCVSFAPLRVNAEGFIEAMGEKPLGNAELVNLGLERMHASFKYAEARRAATNSFDSGVSWRRIGAGGRMLAVTHRKHSAYLMQPLASDLSWFQGMKKFGSYDHSFPRHLVDGQRQRVIGSSDAAFVVELTPGSAHLPRLLPADEAEPDKFNQNMSHHAANRNVLAIWRPA